MSLDDTPTTAAPAAGARAGGAQGTVRRIIVYTILFVLVCVAATGVSGLLGQLFETRPDFGGGTAGLALSLAFTLVGGPVAILLWWFVWRRLDGADRGSVAWGLYLAAITFVSLVTFVSALLQTLADLTGGRWSPESLATGIAWLAVWVAHVWMGAHPTKSPGRLPHVPTVLGAAFGLIVGASGAIRALDVVFAALVSPGLAHIGSPWWLPAVQALIWLTGGVIVWWWYWVGWGGGAGRRGAARHLTGGFADVVLVLTGILAAAATALAGVGVALYVALRTLFDQGDPWREIVAPLPLALAAACIAAIVWVYHQPIALARSSSTRYATRLVEAGLGLIAAASGIGVIVNALLASFSPPLAGDDARALLLGGIASLVVGAPVWWLAWRPDREAADAGATARRIYLVAVFGVSAVVAIVAVLVVGYRIFEFTLDDALRGNIIERIRAPFGLLLATGLVAGYHFAIWRRSRAAQPSAADARAIERIVLVGPGDTTDLARSIESTTGASVTRWTRTGEAGHTPETAVVVEALSGIRARRVLVVVSADGRVEVIELAD